MESIQGAKSTKAQNLRTLHNKKKFEESLAQDRRAKQERLLSQEQTQYNPQTQHNQSFLQADDSIMVENQEFGQNDTQRSPRDTLGEPSFMTTSRTVAGPSTQKVRHRDRRGVYKSIEVKKERSPSKQEEYELR